MQSTESIRSAMVATGFASVAGPEIEALIPSFDKGEWQTFAASWDDLALDAYLLEKGIRRRRRHAVFSVSAAGVLAREAHQPHYQSRQYNSLQGGIERWFEPVTAEIGSGRLLTEVLRLCASMFAPLRAEANWHVEVHQFRIEASESQSGQPTPEGMHRDGVDYVLVLLVTRSNVASGTTRIETTDGQLLGSFTLTNAFDAVFVDDARVAHGVTAIHPLDATKPAYRDVLVVTFRA